MATCQWCERKDGVVDNCVEEGMAVTGSGSNESVNHSEKKNGVVEDCIKEGIAVVDCGSNNSGDCPMTSEATSIQQEICGSGNMALITDGNTCNIPSDEAGDLLRHYS